MSIIARTSAPVNRVSRHFGVGVVPAPRSIPTEADRQWAADYYGNNGPHARQMADYLAERDEADKLEADALAEHFGASEAIRYAEMGLAYA